MSENKWVYYKKNGIANRSAITVDLEDWYHSIESIPVQDWDKYESRLEENTYRILEILNQYEVKATFFVLGYVAEKFPALVKTIQLLGHEIATHGYFHRLIYRLTPEAFREDLKRSIKVIEDLTQQRVLGYRAPYWTITKESYWALEVLQEEGIRYDSSIYPIKTYLYGIPDSPKYPYIIKENNGNKLIEFPPSIITIWGLRVPMGGGFYMRALPSWFIRWGIKKINQEGQPALIYIHPPEFDPLKPVIKLPLKEKILHYYNLGVIEQKLKSLLSAFSFYPLKEILNL